MLKGTFSIAACIASLMGCATARSEPGDQPTTAYSQTTQTRTTVAYVPVNQPNSLAVSIPGCGQPNGGTGLSDDGVEVIHETPETGQALAANGISATQNGFVGRNFRLDALECQGVRTVRFIVRGSRTGPDGWHVRIIAANSDCTADLAIVQNVVATNFLPSATTRACRTQLR